MKLLQYINLTGCKSLVKLPASISKLHQLRYLDLSGTSIKYIPRGLNGLTSLRKLYGFPADVDGGRCSLEELGALSHLMELSISGLENVSSSSFATKARIDEKVCLTFLRLECTSKLGDDGQLVKEEEGISKEVLQQIEEVFDELCPPPGLENLLIKGYFGQRFPRWMMSTTAVPFRGLRNLTMDDLAYCTELPNGLCQLPCLELLQIIHAPAIKRVGSEFLQPNHNSHNHCQVRALFPRLSKLFFDRLVEWEEQAEAMPILEMLKLKKCKLRHVPPGLAFHARALKKLFVYKVMRLRSLENFASVVVLEVFRNIDLERISNLPKLQKLTIVNCPKLKVLQCMPALQRLQLEDYEMETVPRYLQDVNPRHLLLLCSLPLLACIAAGKSGPEWDKFSHIQQVKAFADDEDEGISKKWHVLYTRDPFRFETNICRSAIAKARNKRKWFAYVTCPIEEESPVGQQSHADKRQPLCQRFSCDA